MDNSELLKLYLEQRKDMSEFEKNIVLKTLYVCLPKEDWNDIILRVDK